MPDEDFLVGVATFLWCAAYGLGICLVCVMLGKALYG